MIEIYNLDTTIPLLDQLKNVIPKAFIIEKEIDKPLLNGNKVLSTISQQIQSTTKALILETNYIDRDYLIDFQHYHLSCYQHYKKACMRIHFFDKDFHFTNPTSVEFLVEYDDMANHHIGYLVIRPIPLSFIGRTLITPKISHDPSIGNQFILKQSFKLHLLGKTISTESIPFIQQDRSVGACSPTALWVALNALKKVFDLGKIPAISELTEMNNYPFGNYNRTFPNTGLYIPQLEFIIKNLGLEPDYMYPEQFYSPYRIIQAMIKGNIPVMIVIEFWEKMDDSEKPPIEFIEFENEKYQKSDISHMCVILGIEEKYRLSNPTHRKKLLDEYATNEYILSETIEKMVIHDDNLGPFQEARLVSTKDNEGKNKYILDYLGNKIEGKWILSDILIASSKKIHVSHTSVQELIMNFHRSINTISLLINNELQDFITNHSKNTDNLKETSSMGDVVEYLKNLQTNEYGRNFIDTVGDLEKIAKEFLNLHISWNVYLSSCNKYKKNIRNSVKYSENTKLDLLQADLPRYLWLCRAFSLDSGNLVGEILIDATDFDPPYCLYKCWFENSVRNNLKTMCNNIKYINPKSLEPNWLLKQISSNSWRTTTLLSKNALHERIIRFFDKLFCEIDEQ